MISTRFIFRPIINSL